MSIEIHPQYRALSHMAWHARNKATLRGDCPVGCAVVNHNGNISVGANIELPFRRGLHAEVAALSQLAYDFPRTEAMAIVIAAERDQFTPCGDCMDWILNFGTIDTIVICENSPGQVTLVQKAGKLMPFYPRLWRTVATASMTSVLARAVISTTA